MTDWQRTYDRRDLNYLSARAKQIHDTAYLLAYPRWAWSAELRGK
jgi:hypothetical protein